MKRKKMKRPWTEKEKIKKIHEEGARICKKIGHVWIKHYNNARKSEKVKCARCGEPRRGKQ